MLTKLPNGSAVDLSKAATIQAAEASEQFPNILPRVIIKWFHERGLGRHDSYHECQIVNCDTFEQACQERDRLIDIANRQSSKTVRIENSYFRCRDIKDVSVSARCVCIDFTTGARHIISSVNFDSDEHAHKCAREIMEQVAGVAE